MSFIIFFSNAINFFTSKTLSNSRYDLNLSSLSYTPPIPGKICDPVFSILSHFGSFICPSGLFHMLFFSKSIGCLTCWALITILILFIISFFDWFPPLSFLVLFFRLFLLCLFLVFFFLKFVIIYNIEIF